MGFDEVTPEEFVRARQKFVEDSPAFAHYLTPYDVSMIRRASGTTFLSTHRNTGFILFYDGEIANLFSRSHRGEEGLQYAVHLGGERSEWFDEPHLNDLYARNGFREVYRIPFDDGTILLDFPSYDFEKNGRPDYIVAHRDPARYVREKKIDAYARSHEYNRKRREALAEGQQWEERLRALIGPHRDPRTPQERLDEGWGGW